MSSVSDKNASWVKLRYAKDDDPAHFYCERCLIRSTVPFPVDVTEWSKNIRTFVKAHRNCRPTTPTRGGTQ